MTTNTNPSRTTARFYAAATTNGHGLFEVIDRTDPRIVTAIKGRAEARRVAAVLTEHADLIGNGRVIETKATKKAKAQGKAAKAKPAKAEPKAEAPVRTSHADCAHASSKLARAICRRDRAKADA